MTVDIGGALKDGIGRVGTQAGAIFVGVFLVGGVAMEIAQRSLVASVLRWIALNVEYRDALAEIPGYSARDMLLAVEGEAPLAYIDGSIPLIVAIILAIWVIQVLVKVGAIRWFVETQSGSIEPGHFLRRIVWTLANLFVGGVIYVFAVGLGLLLFLIPGVFLGVALYFYNYEIVVEGENAFSALGNSWKLTEGARIELFALGFVVAVGLVVGWIVGVVTGFSPLVGVIATSLVGSLFTVATIAIAGDAYNQLRGTAGTAPTSGGTADDAGPATF